MNAMLLDKAVWRLKDNAIQWFWWISNVHNNKIGYDHGLLTRLREKKHKTIRRKVHICLLEVNPKGGKFGRFTAFWINERSAVCSASVNERIRDADVIWIYSQDPLSPEHKSDILRTMKEAREGTPVINHPDVYNSYHKEGIFTTLEKAGLSVPRSLFTERDIGKCHVVYKMKDRHGGSKELSLYRGDIEGYRPFEFVDSKGSDGYYRKCRALYIAGIVYPHYMAFSDHWNVERNTITHVDFTFDMKPTEVAAVRTIAHVLNMQYFSVDYLRRASDDYPFFTDINIYPQPIAFTETARQFGYYGRWHIVDNRLRLGMQEPFGRPFWEIFDETMTSFADRGV